MGFAVIASYIRSPENLGIRRARVCKSSSETAQDTWGFERRASRSRSHKLNGETNLGPTFVPPTWMVGRHYEIVLMGASSLVVRAVFGPRLPGYRP